jgi:hypothetical protein
LLDRDGKWYPRVVTEAKDLIPGGKYFLWHRLSGPLCYVWDKGDPFLGWHNPSVEEIKKVHTQYDSSLHNEKVFSPGHGDGSNQAQSFELYLDSFSTEKVDLFQIGFIGDYYKSIGHAAKPEIKKEWLKLKQWFKKNSVSKTKWCGPNHEYTDEQLLKFKDEVFVLSDAQKEFEKGELSSLKYFL